MEKKDDSLEIFLKLANECENTNPVIAFTCRIYYIEKYLELKKQFKMQSSPEEKEKLNQLLTIVENTKKTLKITNEERKPIVEAFCLKEYHKIIKAESEAEKLTQDHASCFYVVSSCIELLNTCSSMTPEWIQKSIVLW